MKPQKNTSADTSVNKEKLPAIYTKKQLHLELFDSILDYGCGKYPEILMNKAKELGVDWHGYDPFNLKGSSMKPADCVICSNVLNVIDSDDAMIEAIHNCFNLGNTVIFSIYVGPDKVPVWSDKYQRYINRPSGIGRQTKPDQWQRNEPVEKYLNLMQSLGYDVEMKYGFIIGKGTILNINIA